MTCSSPWNTLTTGQTSGIPHALFKYKIATLVYKAQEWWGWWVGGQEDFSDSLEAKFPFPLFCLIFGFWTWALDWDLASGLSIELSRKLASGEWSTSTFQYWWWWWPTWVCTWSWCTTSSSTTSRPGLSGSQGGKRQELSKTCYSAFLRARESGMLNFRFSKIILLRYSINCLSFEILWTFIKTFILSCRKVLRGLREKRRFSFSRKGNVRGAWFLILIQLQAKCKCKWWLKRRLYLWKGQEGGAGIVF